MQKAFKYTPKDAQDIIIRKFDFEFPDDLNPHWVPGKQQPAREAVLPRICCYLSLPPEPRAAYGRCP